MGAAWERHAMCESALRLPLGTFVHRSLFDLQIILSLIPNGVQ